jgi:putative flippase GtrA
MLNNFVFFIDKNYKRIFYFFLAGLPSFLISIALNWIFVFILNFSVSLSYGLVLVMQISINFFLCDKFVFDDFKKTNKLKKFINFMIIIIFFRLLDFICYLIMVNFFSFYFLFVQIINTIFFGLFKYLFVKRVMIS